MQELKIDNFNVDKDALIKDFEIAKKDEFFSKIVAKLHLPDSYLKNYTSLIEQSASEFRNCCNCKNLAECKNRITGFAYLPKVINNNLMFEYKPCKYKKISIKRENSLRNIKNYHTPEVLKEADISKIYKTDKNRFKAITWLLDFLDNYKKSDKGLFLHGNFGCGKTYLIAAAFNELSKKGYKSSIVFWPDFIRGAFDNQFKDTVDYIKSVDLLLIDDLGAENLTAYNRDEILCPILQYRMDNKLTTFITSNLNIDDLNTHLSTSKSGVEIIKAGRIISRVKQLTIDMELISKNLRN